MPVKKTSSKTTAKKKTTKSTKKDKFVLEKERFIIRVDYPNTSSVVNYIIEAEKYSLFSDYSTGLKTHSLLSVNIAVDENNEVVHYDQSMIDHFTSLLLPAEYVQSIRGL